MFNPYFNNNNIYNAQYPGFANSPWRTFSDTSQAFLTNYPANNPQNGYQNGMMPNYSNNQANYPNNQVPQAMSGAFPYQPQPIQQYAKGGAVKPKKPSYKGMASVLKKQGQRKDKILAHINPQEAQLLRQNFGQDTNPKTGLPQFGLLKNPGKWLKGSLGGGLGVVLGNMIMPGVGGIIGGALGGAAGSAARGRKDFGKAALRGAGMGAIAPTAASLLGSGLTSAGATGAGGYLSNYGNANAILPALGFGGGAAATGGMLGAAGTAGTLAAGAPTVLSSANTGLSGVNAGGDGSYLDLLGNKSKSFFSEPGNLLAGGSVLASALKRPKEKSPEKLAEEKNRYELALLNLTPEQRAKKEEQLLADEKLKRRVALNKFLPEERLGYLDPLEVEVNSPEEQKTQRKWLNYSKGVPRTYKKGGLVKALKKNGGGQEEKKNTKYALKGNTPGQSDEIPALLAAGEHVIPSDVVSAQGDGNTNAGHRKFDKMISDTRKKIGRPNKLPPKSKSLATYMK